MLFNSLEFLLFFPLVCAFYFMLPARWRWLLLLIASYLFYAAWRVEYVGLIALSTLIDYWAGLRIESTSDPRRRKLYLTLSIVSNLTVLGAFKYFYFFGTLLNELFTLLQLSYNLPLWELLLPVGISFYTFQSLSYSVDVYRGVQKAERHLGIFALYVSFFPQLVAGPVERSSRLLPQFRQPFYFDADRIVKGLVIVGWGFFQKLVIADRLALYVTEVYSNVGTYQGVPVLLANAFFYLQLYCDFAGYSNIAIGTALVLGYRLMENFRQPLFATSIPDLWRRWHISLTTWFGDYLYRPLYRLRPKRVSRVGWHNVTIFATFVLIGLWHGASLTFIVFGILSGLFIVLDRPLQRFLGWLSRAFPKRHQPVLHGLLGHFLTQYLIVVVLLMPAFRAPTLGAAWQLLGDSLRLTGPQPYLVAGFGHYQLALALAAVGVLLIVDALEARRGQKISELVFLLPRYARWTLYYGIIFAILMFGQFQTQPFEYFQF